MIATETTYIPPRGYGGRRKYPWHTMEIGGYFVHDGAENTARTHASQMNRRYKPKHWACRKSEWERRIEVWRDK